MWDTVHLGAGRRTVGTWPRTTSRDKVITLSPDGERLASLSADGAVHVWTVDDRQPLGEPHAFDDVGFATAIAFSPDGTLAIAGDLSRAVLVDPETGEAQPTMRLPDGEPTAIEFNHAGTVVAIANSDGRTQLFDAETRLELGAPLAASSSRSTTSPSAPTTPSWPPAAPTAPARSGASTVAAPSPPR